LLWKGEKSNIDLFVDESERYIRAGGRAGKEQFLTVFQDHIIKIFKVHLYLIVVNILTESFNVDAAII